MTIAPEKPQRPLTPSGSLIASFRAAWTGLLETAERQRNMRIHLVAALLVGLVGSAVPLGLAEKVTLIFCVTLVLFAEILNSSLEALVDLHTEEFREHARISKDGAAAGVLVLAMGTVVIFAALIVHNWGAFVASAAALRRQVALGVPLAALEALLLWPRHRPALADVAGGAAGFALVLASGQWTTSLVFTAMTAGFFGVACLVAARRHRRRLP